MSIGVNRSSSQGAIKCSILKSSTYCTIIFLVFQFPKQQCKHYRYSVGTMKLDTSMVFHEEINQDIFYLAYLEFIVRGTLCHNYTFTNELSSHSALLFSTMSKYSLCFHHLVHELTTSLSSYN